MPDNSEITCATRDVTPDGFSITSPILPYRGQRIVAYIDRLGRIEGTVVRVNRDTESFAMILAMTVRKKKQIANVVAQITQSELAQRWDVVWPPLESTSKLRPLLDRKLIEETLGLAGESAENTPHDQRREVPKSNSDPLRKYLDFD